MVTSALLPLSFLKAIAESGESPPSLDLIKTTNHLKSESFREPRRHLVSAQLRPLEGSAMIGTVVMPTRGAASSIHSLSIFSASDAR